MRNGLLKALLWVNAGIKDCCVSEHPDSLRCGKPEFKDGDEKMQMLIQSEEVRDLIKVIHC